MRFPYYQVTSTGFVPIVPIKIDGKNGWIGFEAYIDSEASFSIFGIERAEILGIDYSKRKRIFLTIEDGSLIEAYPHRLKVKLGNKIFFAQIGFSKQLGVGFNLLGRRDFFDDLHKFVELTPLKLG